MRMFLPFGQRRANGDGGQPKPETTATESELESLRRQMSDMQQKLDRIVTKD